MKQFKGKAIYNPSGKAGEYSYWACNFYTGCSNNCDYCYCKRGVLSSTWSDTPKLKRCFQNEGHAYEIFKKELLKNVDELRRHGLFFTFTSDPMLSEAIGLTYDALGFCVKNSVPVKILTKRADWVSTLFQSVIVNDLEPFKNMVAFGFTLTGTDEQEPGASPNEERIAAMAKLHAAGFKTWASIEPIIDLASSYAMIARTTKFCDHYKVGLQSGKAYKTKEVANFLDAIGELEPRRPIYLKDSIFKYCNYPREVIEQTAGDFVGRDYNIFSNH